MQDINECNLYYTGKEVADFSECNPFLVHPLDLCSSAGEKKNKEYQDTVTNIELSWECKKINDYEFSGYKKLTSITIDNKYVNTIGEGAFEGCTSLKSITIPDSVTTIGTYAFKGCNSLISIIIPKHIENIDELGIDLQIIIKNRAAYTIQKTWRRCRYDSIYKMYNTYLMHNLEQDSGVLMNKS